jgi:hypothetical protein
MFATRNLKMGDLVYAERPILMTRPAAHMPLELPPNTSREQMVHMTLREWERTLQVTFDRLTPERQTACLALANSHTEDGSGPILGIIRTNGFGVKLCGEGELKTQQVTVVCEILSRINHRYVAFCYVPSLV